MQKKHVFLVTLGTLLTLSATVVSAQTMSWHFGSDGMGHMEDMHHTDDHTNIVVDNSSSSPTVAYYHMPHVDQSEQTRLRSLFQEHASLAADTLVSRYDNSPQFDAAQEALNKNSNLIEQEIGKMYGSDVQNQFTTIWQNHNDQYIRYTDGLKGNTTLKDDAKAQLDSIIEQLATLFDNKTGASHDELVDLFKNHVYFTRQFIDMHAAGNYRMQFEYGHTGFEHAAAMSDALAAKSL